MTRDTGIGLKLTSINTRVLILPTAFVRSAWPRCAPKRARTTCECSSRMAEDLIAATQPLITLHLCTSNGLALSSPNSRRSKPPTSVSKLKALTKRNITAIKGRDVALQRPVGAARRPYPQNSKGVRNHPFAFLFLAKSIFWLRLVLRFLLCLGRINFRPRRRTPEIQDAFNALCANDIAVG